MFYQEILVKVLNGKSSNFEIQDYRKKINKFVKSGALLQLFDENTDTNKIKYYMCLIRDDNFNYYFVLLDNNFEYRCHTYIYDTVYNYIKLDEYVKYNQEDEIEINENILNEVKEKKFCKMNIILLRNNNLDEKILLVKLLSGNYLFWINDDNNIKNIKNIKILKYKQI